MAKLCIKNYISIFVKGLSAAALERVKFPGRKITFTIRLRYY